MITKNKVLNEWVKEVADLTQPDSIHWCSGSKEEQEKLVQLMLDDETFIKLNGNRYKNCYLHRSDPNDVARTEHLTYICTEEKEDAGPNNNWMAPKEARVKSKELFAGSMKGRIMYVVPYCMGPIASPYSQYGVEITDSPYVVANMRIMTRMGSKALQRIEETDSFVKGLHCTGDLSIEKRIILHFPEKGEIHSFSSGYGGNALLGKKCHALRIASWQAQKGGWLAEHMLIVGLESPEGDRHYVAAAFPSACGKTNLAMLIPPELYKDWKVWTVGDDIAWMHIGKDGRLYAINPEAGYFGVVPGTSEKTNPNALQMIENDAIFTNVALTEKSEPWWEGKTEGKPVVNWKGEKYAGEGPAAHPNSRFTVSSTNCPSYDSSAELDEGVPISAIIFGGRRSELVPLVMESKSWQHGVLLGASMSSQTTAAALGQTGVLRNDPMAMKPFCGYHFGKYWQHWLSFEKRASRLPKIFHVNWFRTSEEKKFLWPGFCENIRVLEWILKRVKGTVTARETAIGNLPHTQDLNLKGLDVPDKDLQKLCALEDGWDHELDQVQSFLKTYEPEVPQELLQEIGSIRSELKGTSA